jgi:hypothetical protein
MEQSQAASLGYLNGFKLILLHKKRENDPFSKVGSLFIGGKSYPAGFVRTEAVTLFPGSCTALDF